MESKVVICGPLEDLEKGESVLFKENQDQYLSEIEVGDANPIISSLPLNILFKKRT